MFLMNPYGNGRSWLDPVYVSNALSNHLSAQALNRYACFFCKCEFRCNSRPRKKHKRIRIIQFARHFCRRVTKSHSRDIKIHRPNRIRTRWNVHRVTRYIHNARRQPQPDLEILLLRQRISALVVVLKNKAMVTLNAGRHTRCPHVALLSGMRSGKYDVIGARLPPKSFKNKFNVLSTPNDAFICPNSPSGAWKS